MEHVTYEKFKNLTELSQNSGTSIVLKATWAVTLKSEMFIEILGLSDVSNSVSCMLFVNVFAEAITNTSKILFSCYVTV
jgi:hypothetical protein